MPVCSHPPQKRGGCAAGSPPHPLRSHGGDGPAGPGETAPPPRSPLGLGVTSWWGRGGEGEGTPHPPFSPPPPHPPLLSASPDGAARGRAGGGGGVSTVLSPPPGAAPPSVCPCVSVGLRLRGSAHPPPGPVGTVPAAPPRGAGESTEGLWGG